MKHLLWHGNTEEALQRLGDLLLELSLIQARSAAAKKVADGLSEFETYIRNNRDFIPNFGERRRQGETISTAFVESTINQVVSRRFVKKQTHFFDKDVCREIFTQTNYNMAARGGKIIRVFIVTDDKEVRSIKNIIKDQLQHSIDVRIAYASNLSTEDIKDLAIFDDEVVATLETAQDTHQEMILIDNPDRTETWKNRRDKLLAVAGTGQNVLRRLK